MNNTAKLIEILDNLVVGAIAACFYLMCIAVILCPLLLIGWLMWIAAKAVV